MLEFRSKTAIPTVVGASFASVPSISSVPLPASASMSGAALLGRAGFGYGPAHEGGRARLPIALAIVAALGLVPEAAVAGTCSERHQVCLAYCAKTYNNAPKCLRACAGYMGECTATGCWESKITAKQCGFTRS